MNPLQNLYEDIDILKDSKIGKVTLVYDRTGKQVCVMKERSLKTFELYSRLKEIKNPCLPEIYRTVKFGDALFVVEEFIEGQTLAEILTYQGALNEKISAQILKQVCDCLKILHAEKIIHRDLKPSNIMLTKDNQVKLIDFSISRIAKDNLESDTDFLGTRGYAPPEQFGFGQTDSRSDIFSLGVTMKKVLGENYSGYLKKILSKCTELDPAHRYQNVEEISADIDKKFWQYRLKKIFINLSGISAIVLAVLFLPTVFVEKVFESESPTEHKKVETKKSPPPQVEKIPEVKDNYKFPEIKIPVEEVERWKDGKVESNNSSLLNPNSSLPTDLRLKKFCTLYLNGKNFYNDIPANVWQSWRRDGDKIYFPADWNLTLKVENKNDFALTNIKISVNLDGRDRKNFSASIPARQEKIFSIPLGSYNFSGEDFEIEIKLTSDDEIDFAWQGGNFGNYKSFKIYLLNYSEWRTKIF